MVLPEDGTVKAYVDGSLARVRDNNTKAYNFEGDVWSFTTANFLVTDDFESYNDLDPTDPASNRIFNAWIDGFDNPPNGSFVGYENSPFAEQTIVHGGSQSMPFAFENAVRKPKLP